MALSIEQLKNRIITSIHGRRIGFDENDYLVGPKDLRKNIVDYTSGSTGTTVLPYGVHSFQLTTLSTQDFLLSNPVPGVAVTIVAQMSGATNLSSNWNLKRPSTAFYIESSEGSTLTTINMSSRSFVTLMGISTDRYQVISRTPATTGSTGIGPQLNGTT